MRYVAATAFLLALAAGCLLGVAAALWLMSALG